MTRIYLIRHGETKWNKQNMVQGCRNTCLSKTGISQARILASRFSEYNIAYIYSSDLCRASRTAQFVADELNLQVVPLKDLREICFGEWEGLSLSDIETQYGQAYKKWRIEPHKSEIPGEKSLIHAQERIMRTIEGLVEKHKNQNIVIITHSGSIKLAILGFLNIDLSLYNKFWQGNTAVNILDFKEDKVVLSLYNDTCHLEK